MLFNSFQFLLFFPIVTILYFILPHKFRWLHLLIASCVFYMYFVPIYILILFLTIIVDYIAGILIENAKGPQRKAFLLMSIVANVGVLVFFKYYNFFADNVNHLFLWTHLNANIPLLKIILPIGLSFHTFQAMSYTIEVFRGKQKAERHFGIYALYVMFYPQLVAGPIERPQNMLHQFHEKHYFKYDDVVIGLRMMLWGLFKKSVIADRLAVITDPIFNNPHSYTAVPIVMAVIFFTFEIYCDFSGYSNMALGAARVMGFKLMTNFNWPYCSRSISEFWRRWHISLSTWFNDYLFTPISFSYRNLGIYSFAIGSIITFLISGLWHGAAWTYIAWGGLHGIGITYEVLTKQTRKKFFKLMPKALGDTIALTCTFTYVCFSYILFRANSLKDAFYIAGKIPSIFSQCYTMFKNKHFSGLRMPVQPEKIIYGVIAIVLLQIVYYIQKRKNLNAIFDSKPWYIRWLGYYLFLFLIIYAGVFQNRQFIYFQF